jgi:hypothetical protein
VAELVEGSAGGVGEVVEVGRGEVGHWPALDPSPNLLDGVELRCGGRQEFRRQPGAVVRDELPGLATGRVGGKTVPDQDDAPAATTPTSPNASSTSTNYRKNPGTDRAPQSARTPGPWARRALLHLQRPQARRHSLRSTPTSHARQPMDATDRSCRLTKIKFELNAYDQGIGHKICRCSPGQLIAASEKLSVRRLEPTNLSEVISPTHFGRISHPWRSRTAAT